MLKKSVNKIQRCYPYYRSKYKIFTFNRYKSSLNLFASPFVIRGSKLRELCIKWHAFANSVAIGIIFTLSLTKLISTKFAVFARHLSLPPSQQKTSNIEVEGKKKQKQNNSTSCDVVLSKNSHPNPVNRKQLLSNMSS